MERLESQSTRLKRANMFKGEVLGTVAHDLKNPLGVILGRTEMLTEFLAMSPFPQDSARSQVEHIRQSARRLTAMVDDLVADAMADALDISVRGGAARPRRARGGSRAGQSRAGGGQGAGHHVTGERGLLVSGDVERLREAVDNLVSNAVKYSPIGGRIMVSAKREGNEAQVRVADQGPGLSPEDVGRLFGRFQRLSAKPTGGESSTGLGLSIAKRIIDLHKGRIFVESPGQSGRRGIRHCAAAPWGTQRRMSQQQHIFVVDDEAAARDMIGDYLKLQGFTVTLCDGGPSLRAAVAKTLPDLVVLDLNMPEEDGLSLIRFLKQSGNIPIIMLTATASPIDRVVGLELGADDYLAKPCELRELLARVRSVLRRSAAPAAAPTGTPNRTVKLGTKWLDLDARALQRFGRQRAPAHRLGVQPAQGLRRESQARADARAVAGPGPGARFGGVRPRHRRAHHPHPPQDRAGPGASSRHPHSARRRLRVLPGGDGHLAANVSSQGPATKHFPLAKKRFRAVCERRTKCPLARSTSCRAATPVREV